MSDTDGRGADLGPAAGLHFLVEAGTLAALGYWGYRSVEGTAASVALAVALPLVAAAVWGLFGSPAAPYPLSRPLRLALRAVLLAGAVAATLSLWGPTVAAGFGVVGALDVALLARSQSNVPAVR